MLFRILNAILMIICVFLYFMIFPCLAVGWAVITCNRKIANDLWSTFCTKTFRINFTTAPGSQKIIKTGKNIILCNHRCWGDFFIHDYITEFSCSFLSRFFFIFYLVVLNNFNLIQIGGRTCISTSLYCKYLYDINMVFQKRREKI